MSSRQRPQVVVARDLASLVEAAASQVLACAAGAKDRVAICLTGGSTPKPVYQRLTTEPYRSAISWERIHWFWGDDRFVPHNDERSNARMARAAFLDHLPIPPVNVHALPTGVSSPQEAARLYQQELEQFYGREHLDPNRPLFDLVLAGLGVDGHTASLFPGDAALSETQRWVVAVEKAGLPPFVPRVTLTFPALASTRKLIFLVSGPDKLDVVDRVLSGHDLPAAHAQSHGAIVWMLDRSAAPDRFPTSQTST
jgi:6-phosphogluconolactonase